MVHCEDRSPIEPLQYRLTQAADRLRYAVDEVIRAVPVPIRRPAEFQRVLKLDRSLSSRLLRAVQLHDPLASLHRMPGPQGIRLLLRAAEKANSDREVIARAEEALVALERMIAAELGDWKELEAAISGWLPDAREQFEMANRQAAFRAMSNIKGVTADAEISVTLIHPGNSKDGWLDRAGITGICRMRRLRAGAPMGLLHGSSIAPPPGMQRLSLFGQPIDAEHGAPLLEEFSSSPTPSFDVLVEGDAVHYMLQGDDVGMESMVDLLFADVMHDRYPMHAGISSRPATPGALIDIPVRTLIVDVLVHEGVWPDIVPELRMYDTAGRGVANPTDPARNIDRIDVLESIQDIGTHMDRFRTKEVARYVEMVEFVCDKLGWKGERFRGFRCRADFPIYGTQLSMVFHPPGSKE